MKRVRLWEGSRGTSSGYDASSYEWLEVEAESLGSWTEWLDDRGNRGVTYDVYRTAEGTIIIHKVTWSRWSDERDYALIVEFATLEQAAEHYRRELENARIIERKVLSLDEWRQRKQNG
jgi:uncharacterized protein Usg